MVEVEKWKSGREGAYWNSEGMGVEHFGISKVRGGVKMFTPPVVGYGYFLESPNGV